MGLGKPKRRRGVLLSDYGLSRVFEEQRRLAAENNCARLSLEAFSADVGLSTRTLSRLLNRASPVDFRTVETLFFAPLGAQRIRLLLRLRGRRSHL